MKEKLITWKGIAIFIIFFGVWGIFILLSGWKYNPEIHNCIDYEWCNSNHLKENYLGDGWICVDGDWIDGNDLDYHHLFCKNQTDCMNYKEWSKFYRCVDWESKNECELGNPDYRLIEGCPDYKCTCDMPYNQSLCDSVLKLCMEQAQKLPKGKMGILTKIK